MILSDVLDRLGELGDIPLCAGMHDYDRRYCAAAHMLMIVGAKGKFDDTGYNPYEEFKKRFGFEAAEVFYEIDYRHSTASDAARALRTHLADRLDRTVQVSAEGSLHGV